MTKEELIKELIKEFPYCWFKDGAEFSPEFVNSIWTGENSFIDDIPAFDYYSEYHTIYEFGVHKALREFVEPRGWYFECYDPGTYFIFKQ